MPKYYCPFCSPQYQLHKQRSDGVMICGYCGDPLVKLRVIRPKQLIALIAASAFIAPLILMVASFIQNSNQPDAKEPLQAMAVLKRSITIFR